MSDTFNNFATSTPRLTVTSNNVDSSHESSNGSPTSWRLSQIVSRCRSRITSNGGVCRRRLLSDNYDNNSIFKICQKCHTTFNSGKYFPNLYLKKRLHNEFQLTSTKIRGISLKGGDLPLKPLRNGGLVGRRGGGGVNIFQIYISNKVYIPSVSFLASKLGDLP